MEQEKILSLILSKLDNIEKEQQEIKKEIKGINNEVQIMKNDIKEINNEVQIVKNDIKEINNEVQIMKNDIKDIKSIQNTIQEFMLSTEKAIEVYEQDHKFIEKLKKVAGE